MQVRRGSNEINRVPLPKSGEAKSRSRKAFEQKTVLKLRGLDIGFVWEWGRGLWTFYIRNRNEGATILRINKKYRRLIDGLELAIEMAELWANRVLKQDVIDTLCTKIK